MKTRPITARSRRLLCLALLTAAGTAHPVVRADVISSLIVRADNASLVAAGLPYIPTGAGVRVAQSEPSLPYTSNDAVLSNPNMPAGAGAAANGRIVRITHQGNAPSFGFHATAVAGTIMAPVGGISPNIQLFSNQNVAASMWASQHSLRNAGDNAKILNMSWGPGRPRGTNSPARDGNGEHAVWTDWASGSYNGRGVSDKLMIIAGNETFGANFESSGLDDSYNGITVASSAWNGYGSFALYNISNTTQEASPYNNGRVGRFKTDIVAPGGGPFAPNSGAVLAAPVQWGDVRDTNNGALVPDGLNSQPGFAGTSFAAPHVTGGAALLQDFATNRGLNDDHRVLKAVMLNGASKAITTWDGRAWGAAGPIGVFKNNGAGGGPIGVRVGWDPMMGTGQMDVAASLLNYNAGRHAPGINSGPNGFDIRTVTGQGSVMEYELGVNIQSLTTTLSWDRYVTLNDANADTVWEPGETFNLFTLNDLDLEVWRYPVAGGPAVKMFESNSDMDSIEHLAVNFAQAFDADRIALRVRFYRDYTPQFGTERYGLAWRSTGWAIPAPGVVSLAAVAGLFASRRRRPPA